MMGPGDNANPFRPGAGQMPPFLAGRDTELGLAERRLRQLAGGTAPPQGILLYGPRGNGKTVLLERIAERAREMGMRAERLPPAALRDAGGLVAELRECAGLGEARLTGLHLGPVGATTERAIPTANVSRLLSGWILAVSSPLVIVLDEIHTMESEVGRTFFEAVQNAGADRLPFFVVAAGTPDAPRKVRRAGTFAERAFEKLPIGRLTPPATAEALKKPAEAAGRPMDAEALARLVGESQDYPYFIQLLGSAAWDAAAGAEELTMGRRAAAAGAEEVRTVVKRFYAERFDEARARKVESALPPLARLFAERGRRFGELEVGPLMRRLAAPDSVPGDEVWLLETLSDLGVLWRSSAGWEMGIPSFADYLLSLDPADAPGE